MPLYNGKQQQQTKQDKIAHITSSRLAIKLNTQSQTKQYISTGKMKRNWSPNTSLMRMDNDTSIESWWVFKITIKLPDTRNFTQRELNIEFQTKSYTQMFIEALSTIGKRWKQCKNPGTGELIKKIRFIHTIKYHSSLSTEQEDGGLALQLRAFVALADYSGWFTTYNSITGGVYHRLLASVGIGYTCSVSMYI